MWKIYLLEPININSDLILKIVPPHYEIPSNTRGETCTYAIFNRIYSDRIMLQTICNLDTYTADLFQRL